MRDRYWTVDLRDGESLHAKFIAVASGRNSILPSTKTVSGEQTIALYSYWSGVDPECGETLVEASSSQWYWGAPLPDGTFNATVFVDREVARTENYHDLIHQSHLLSARLKGAVCEEVKACDATSFVDDSPITPCSIRVGDAALTIDPLSSQGVQTAIGTAIHAAAVINTILDRPGDINMAVDFYRRRITESAQFHARTAAQQYREQWLFSPTPFWRARMAAEDVEERRVSRKLVSLEQRMCISPRATFVPVSIVTERYIVESEGIALDGKVFSRLGEHDISKLLSEIPCVTSVRAVLEKWSQYVPPHSAVQILEWAWERGLLEGPEQHSR